MKQITKEDMKTVVERIVESSERSSRENPIYNFLVENAKWITMPRDFDTMIHGELRTVIREVIKKATGYTSPLVLSIYCNYHFYESHVSELCTTLYGIACCVDRARYIINQSIQWEISGQDVDKISFAKGKYWIPKTGTPRQWFSFVKSLSQLLYGRPRKYFLALMDFSENTENGDQNANMDDRTNATFRKLGEQGN